MRTVEERHIRVEVTKEELGLLDRDPEALAEALMVISIQQGNSPMRKEVESNPNDPLAKNKYYENEFFVKSKQGTIITVNIRGRY